MLAHLDYQPNLAFTIPQQPLTGIGRTKHLPIQNTAKTIKSRQSDLRNRIKLTALKNPATIPKISTFTSVEIIK
jgi:hypothetical protein